MKDMLRKLLPVRESVFLASREMMRSEREQLRRENEEMRGLLHRSVDALEEANRLLTAIKINTDKIPFGIDKFADIEMLQKQLMDPELYPHAIAMWYENMTGNILNLDDPQTYNEKIQWMKLYDKDPRKSLLTDKITVRDYVEDRIGLEYLIPLIGTYDYVEEIDFDALPRQFVLKASHGCAMNEIVRDKAKMNIAAVKKKAKKWLETNFAFVNGFELHYLDIPHRLLIEEYIQNGDGDLPDYKFWCFNGKVHYVMYLAERSAGLKMVFFDREWRKLPFVYSYPRYEKDVPRPDNLDEMIEAAERLASDFSHARVDLYRLDDGRIKFGEITFSSASGACRWNPADADREIGRLFQLPPTSES